MLKVCLFRSPFPYSSANFSTLKKKSSKIWMKEHVDDQYVRKAKLLNYRSRAAFKLIEIQQRYNILREGSKVIDLGSAPGSWTQVAVEYVKSPKDKPTVLAVDKILMPKVPGAHFLVGDVEEEDIRLEISEFFEMNPVDVILSDMAPNFSGDQDFDHMGIAVLNHIAFRMCFNNLKIGGSLVMKTLQGALEQNFFKLYSIFFKEFQRVKPSASRSRSSELFYLGKGFKLGEKYLQNREICDSFNSKVPLTISPEHLAILGQKDNYASFIKDRVAESLEFGLNITKEDEALLKKSGINFEEIKENTKQIFNNENKDEKSKAIYDEFMDKAKLSFMRKIPKTIEEMRQINEERRKKREEILKSGGKDGTLLSSDEELGDFKGKDSEEYKEMMEKIKNMPDEDFEEFHIEGAQSSDGEVNNDEAKKFEEEMKNSKKQLQEEIDGFYNKWGKNNWGSGENLSEIQKKILEMNQEMEKKGAPDEEFFERLREMNEKNEEENFQNDMETLSRAQSSKRQKKERRKMQEYTNPMSENFKKK